MLGESTLVEGTMASPKHSIAYASQDVSSCFIVRLNVMMLIALLQAFIVVGTCRENITFGRPFNQVWYDDVVQACALVADFARMPLQDRTQLGEKGISLSGGQRQRIVSHS